MSKYIIKVNFTYGVQMQGQRLGSEKGADLYFFGINSYGQPMLSFNQIHASLLGKREATKIAKEIKEYITSNLSCFGLSFYQGYLNNVRVVTFDLKIEEVRR